MSPESGKLLAEDNTVFDLTAFYAQLKEQLEADGIKVNAGASPVSSATNTKVLVGSSSTSVMKTGSLPFLSMTATK